MGTTKKICHFHNGQLGIRSVIFQIDDGRFSVRLLDTDANLYLPTARIFPDLEPAKTYAKSII